MCFTHVMNIEGICFLKPVLIEIAHKPAHAWGLPVSYYYFFHFEGRLCFLGKQEKQQGKKALFVSLAWSWIPERFPVAETTVRSAPRHQRVRLTCERLAWGGSAAPWYRRPCRDAARQGELPQPNRVGTRVCRDTRPAKPTSVLGLQIDFYRHFGRDVSFLGARKSPARSGEPRRVAAGESSPPRDPPQMHLQTGAASPLAPNDPRGPRHSAGTHL